MSGYTDELLTDEVLRRHGAVFLRKPFSQADLIAAIRPPAGATAPGSS